MKLGYLMIANGLVGFAFGSALLWFPSLPILLLDIDTNSVGRILLQLLGTALLGYSVATVAGGADDDNSQLQKVIASARLISEILSALVLLFAVFGDSAKATLWVLLILYLLFSAGYIVLGLPVLRQKAESE